MKTDYDVIIVGAGIVGQTMALCLADSPLKIALCDKQLATYSLRDPFELRVSAITPASKQLFKHLNVWDMIKNTRHAPFRKMHVWEQASDADITFDDKDIARPYLGYIIENAVIQKALQQRITENSNIDLRIPMQINDIIEEQGFIAIKNQHGQTLSTKLLIGADGANSWIRKQCQMPIDEKAYEHEALVTTVKTEKPHQDTAWQCFLNDGTIAFLPLPDPHHCSIVWSLPPEKINVLKQATDLSQTITTISQQHLGCVTWMDDVVSFPLTRRHAKQYVKSRVALIGDAAHTIHPLAGQGVNLGLMDAATLTETIQSALNNQRDFSAYDTLRKYERQRKSHNQLMLRLMDGFKGLFTSKQPVLKNIRAFGLNKVDQCAPIKRYLMQQAMGNIINRPKLMEEDIA